MSSSASRLPSECSWEWQACRECKLVALRSEWMTALGVQFSSVTQSLSRVRLFVTPWTAGCQSSLSITSSWSLLKLMSIEAVMPSNHLILSSPSLSAFNPFQHQSLFQWVSSSHQVAKVLGVSASASVLPMNIQDWFPLGWTGWISLQSKGLSRVFSNTIVQKHQFFSVQLSLESNSHIHTWLLEKPELWLDRPLLAK